MQAIITKYLPATDYKGSRIKATCEAGSITIGYPHEVSSGQACHRVAAEKLAAKLGWIGARYGKLLGGGLPNAMGGYCFIFDNSWAHE